MIYQIKNFMKIKSKGVFMSKRKKKITRQSIKKQILEDYKKHEEKYFKSNNFKDKITTCLNIKEKNESKPSITYRSKSKIYNKQSKGEILIELKLKEKGIKFLKEVEFNGLINPKTNKKLRFDFYLPKHNICIEFDGEQHFRMIKEFDGDDITKLPKRRILDKIKTDFCKQKNIKLIRIKYFEINKIDKILKQIK